MPKEQLTNYQLATKNYSLIMATLIFIFCIFLIFKANLEFGSDMGPFFWILVIIATIALIGMLKSGSWASKISKEYHFKERRLWRFYNLPGLILLISSVIPRYMKIKNSSIVSIILFSLALIYIGITSLKFKYLYIKSRKIEGTAAKIISFILISIGIIILLFIPYLLSLT